MTQAPHSAASQHMPWFLTAPGDSDVLMTLTTTVLIVTIFGLGVVFFKLHSLPERLGHKKLQFEIVAVLGLLSLFTHVHAFWVAGLLLALVDLPDFQTPLKRIAASLESLSGTATAKLEKTPPSSVGPNVENALPASSPQPDLGV